MIPHAFGERPAWRLMYAALIRASESWRAVKGDAIRDRQLQALQEDLRCAHAERDSPGMRISTKIAHQRFQQKQDMIQAIVMIPECPPAQPHTNPLTQETTSPVSPRMR
jgi:hypothetical protein